MNLLLTSPFDLAVGIAHLARELPSLTGESLSFIFIGTLAVNVIFSALIAGRLLFHRNNARKIFGPGYGEHYVSIAAMILESAAINIIVQIPAIVFPSTTGFQFFGVPIVGQFQVSCLGNIILIVQTDFSSSRQCRRSFSCRE
jgi:hypothetical protein